MRSSYSIRVALALPYFPRLANRYRDAQLIQAGKGYGLMYSIWARFRDIIERGSCLTGANPLLLSSLHVEIPSPIFSTSLTIVSLQRSCLQGGVPQSSLNRTQDFGSCCRTSSHRTHIAAGQGPQRIPQFTGPFYSRPHLQLGFGGSRGRAA